MRISSYYTGQIPNDPIVFNVRDSKGRVKNLSTYTDYTWRMLGSDNEEVDLTGAVSNTAGAATGRFVFRFPEGRSVFTKPGEYLLQLELSGNGRKDFTSEHTIRVRRFGGNN